MKKSILIWFVLVLCGFFVAPALGAITVDGNLDDWGLTALSGPTSDWSKSDNWIPKDDVSYLVEDNNNPLHSGLPGFERAGVHITGYGTSYTFYDEKSISLNTGTIIAPPWAGESYDLQAIYLTQDADTIYVAAIPSTPQNGNSNEGDDGQPGDLGLNFGVVSGEKYGYEYGVKLGTPNAVGNYQPGDIIYLPDWQDVGYSSIPMADVMKSPALPGGGKVGTAQIAYTDSWLNHEDFGYPNYVIELAIPKAAVGNPGNVLLNQIQIAQNCQNDHLFVPEFPTLAFSIGSIIGLVFVIFSIKSKQ